MLTNLIRINICYLSESLKEVNELNKQRFNEQKPNIKWNEK